MIERWLLFIAVLGGVYLLMLIGLWEGIDADLKGDVVRAHSLALPIIGAFTLWWLKQSTDQRTGEQQEEARQMRMLIALHAEIDLHLESYLLNFGPERSAKTLGGMLSHLNETDAQNAKRRDPSSHENSMPTSVVQKENTVFDQIKPDIKDLPPHIIGPVIRYYQTDGAVLQLAKAFNEGLFETRSLAFRKRMIMIYVANIHEGALDALHAVKILDAKTAPANIGASDNKKSEMRSVRAWLESHRSATEIAALAKEVSL